MDECDICNGHIDYAGNCMCTRQSKAPAVQSLSAQVLVYQPELTHSMWVDHYGEDSDGCRLSREDLVEQLKAGVRSGEWVGWRLMRIEQEVMGNVD